MMTLVDLGLFYNNVNFVHLAFTWENPEKKQQQKTKQKTITKKKKQNKKKKQQQHKIKVYVPKSLHLVCK